MRPHVLGLPEESVLEGALQRSLQRIEVTVGAIALEAIRTERRNGPGGGFRQEAVGGNFAEQVATPAAYIAHLSDKAVGQLLLNVEVPVFVVQVFPVRIDRLRASARTKGAGFSGAQLRPKRGPKSLVLGW